MAPISTAAIASGGAARRPSPRPQRKFLRLDTSDRIRREAVRLYRERRDGLRDVSEVSRLTNCLDVIRRMVETGDIEAWLARLERRTSQ